jgi:hypothetical protein
VSHVGDGEAAGPREVQGGSGAGRALGQVAPLQACLGEGLARGGHDAGDHFGLSRQQGAQQVCWEHVRGTNGHGFAAHMARRCVARGRPGRRPAGCAQIPDLLGRGQSPPSERRGRLEHVACPRIGSRLEQVEGRTGSVDEGVMNGQSRDCRCHGVQEGKADRPAPRNLAQAMMSESRNGASRALRGSEGGLSAAA